VFIIKTQMKHILNNLSNEEKNSIREQHTGGMKVVTENFYRLLSSPVASGYYMVVYDNSLKGVWHIVEGYPQEGGFYN
jgi:hypothetical protein